MNHTALIVVDVQPDFLPGGALAVTDADAILEPLHLLMTSARFDLAVATQDWHPPGHVSFASSHPGREPFESIELYGHRQVLWPNHCVQGTPGAALAAELPWERVAAVIRKGVEPDVDSYSGFRNNWDRDGRRPPTGLAGYLRERGIGAVFIAGLARDVCVRWTAEDALELGFDTTIVWNATRSVEPAGDDDLARACRERGIRVADSAELE